jgi:hypothetical protein
MYVRVNNGTKNNSSFANTGSWNASSAATKAIEVILNQGSNVLVLGSDSGWAPYIDKIALSLMDDNAVKPLSVKSQDQAWYSLGGMSLITPSQTGVYINRNQKYIFKSK